VAELEARLEARLAESISASARATTSTSRSQDAADRSAGPCAIPWQCTRQPSVFDVLTQVDIGSVPHFVNQHCHFLGPSHTSWDVTLSRMRSHTMIACLMAWAATWALAGWGKLRYQLSRTVHDVG